MASAAAYPEKRGAKKQTRVEKKAGRLPHLRIKRLKVSDEYVRPNYEREHAHATRRAVAVRVKIWRSDGGYRALPRPRAAGGPHINEI